MAKEFDVGFLGLHGSIDEETAKAIFRGDFDITTQAPDTTHYSEQDQRIFKIAKRVLNNRWNEEMRNQGITAKPSDFSKDHPPTLLRKPNPSPMRLPPWSAPDGATMPSLLPDKSFQRTTLISKNVSDCKDMHFTSFLFFFTPFFVVFAKKTAYICVWNGFFRFVIITLSAPRSTVQAPQYAYLQDLSK